MSGTRSQRDSDAPETIHFCRCGLETADPRSEAADPLPKESFYHALRVRCDYQTRYSYGVLLQLYIVLQIYCRSHSANLNPPLDAFHFHSQISTFTPPGWGSGQTDWKRRL